MTKHIADGDEGSPCLTVQIAADTERKSWVDNLPRCDCGHLFEICNHPNCYNGADIHEHERS